MILFFVRARRFRFPGTAVQQAALYDARHLASLGHSVAIVAIEPEEVPLLDIAKLLERLKNGELNEGDEV